MKKYLIFMGTFLFVYAFPAILKEKEHLKLPESSSSSSNGKELKRTLSASELEKIQEKRAKERKGKVIWQFKFPGLTVSEYTTENEIRDILLILKKIWNDPKKRPALEYFRYFLKNEFPEKVEYPETFDLKYKENYNKILFENKLMESDKSVKKVTRLVCEEALFEPGKLFLWGDLLNSKIVPSESARKNELWYFKLPNVIRAEYTTGEEIRGIISNLRDIWDENKSALKYFILFLKNKVPASIDPKEQKKFDEILLDGKLMESDKSVKKIVRIVSELALSEPEKLFLFNELRNKKLIQPETERREEEEKIKEYEPDGEFFVFHVSPVRIEEFKTTEKSIKKIYKKFSELKDQERLPFNDIVEGNVILGNIPFVIKGNKEKLEKEVLDYYKKDNRVVPKMVEFLLKVITKPIVENLEKHIELLNTNLAQEDKDIRDRVEFLLGGILSGEKKLKEIENFKLILKEKSLMNKDGNIPYLVKYLWKVLVKPGYELRSLDEAFKEKLIFKKK